MTGNDALPGRADVAARAGGPRSGPEALTGRAALIASVGGQRGYADWTHPHHRVRRVLAEFIGMAGLTFILSGGPPSWSGTAAMRCSRGRRSWCFPSSRRCESWRPSNSRATSPPITTRC
jgi:hypothetical protein